MFVRRSWVVGISLFVALGCSGREDGAGDVSAGADGGAVVDDGGGGGTGPDGSGDAANPGCSVPSPTLAGEVATSRGLARGSAVGGTWRFLGMPYAEPPVGGRRFAEAEPMGCWTAPLQADDYGAVCPQIPATGKDKGKLVGAEDCLRLSVWTPTAALGDGPGKGDGKPRPVWVFVHGGGNVQGSMSEAVPLGSKPIYDGARIAAEQDAVVVTLNYRLGALGWLALPAAAQDPAKPGNAAISDLLTALGWVEDEIAAFGGDPERVLLFGESAGGVNVCALLATPAAKGRFGAAIIESGGCVQPAAAAVVAEHQAAIDKGSCANQSSAAAMLACLRALPVDKVLAELPGGVGITTAGLGGDGTLRMGPIAGGAFLPKSPHAALADGSAAQVPVVFGVNAEEQAGAFLFPVQDDAALTQHIQTVFALLPKAQRDQLVATYTAPGAFADAGEAQEQLYADMRFVCPARRYAKAAAAGGNAAVRRYYFARRAVTKQGETPAKHGIELLYVFGTMSDIPLFSPHADDLALAAGMRAMWGQLARGEAPAWDAGTDAAPLAWPVWDAASDPALRLDMPVAVQQGVITERCNVWEGVFDAIGWGS